MPIVLGRKPGGGGGSGSGVTSLAESGQPALTGAVTLSEGTGVTLTQVGQDIEIASAGGDLVQLHDEVLAGSGTFDVQNISQAYANLQCFLSLRGTQAAAQVDLYARFNNDSGNNYQAEVLTATGGTVASAGGGATAQMHIGYAPAASASAGFGAHCEFSIPNYAGTTLHKGIVGASSSALATFYVISASGLWSNTAAITRIQFFPSAGSFVAGSRLSIYGLS